MLTDAGILAEDKLFATLDTTSRNVFLTPEVQIILTDTVGFISKLPHELVDAFASTLEEAQNADLLLHVVDVSNKDHKLQSKLSHIHPANKQRKRTKKGTRNDIGAKRAKF